MISWRCNECLNWDNNPIYRTRNRKNVNFTLKIYIDEKAVGKSLSFRQLSPRNVMKNRIDVAIMKF